MTFEDEQALHSFIDGENDALQFKEPQSPEDPYYMMGFKDCLYRIRTGELRLPEPVISSPVVEDEF